MLVASCEGAPPDDASGLTPIRGGTLVLGAVGEVTTLQPLLALDSVSAALTPLIYAPLMGSEPATGELRPALAERVSVSRDGERITYTLREGLAWSDGVPLTGEDYTYTAKAVARSKRSPLRPALQDIVGWRDYVEGRADDLSGLRVADGGRTIEVSIVRSSCLAFRRLAFAPIPKHHFVKHWDDRTTDTARSIDDSPFNLAPPAASGPFVFSEYRRGDQVRLVRNERYFRGAPLLGSVVWKTFGTRSAVRVAFMAGDILQTSVRPEDVAEIRQRVGGNAREYRLPDVTAYTFIGWNRRAARAPWLANVGVRHALWYGLDIETIIDKVALGYGHRVFAHTPSSSWAYDGTGLNRYEFDPTKARALLEASGATLGADGLYRWTDGSPMRLRLETNADDPARASLVQLAAQQYRALGIEAEFVLESLTPLLQRVGSSDPSVEGFVLGWNLGPDPDAYNIWHSSQVGGLNVAAMTNAELDAALEAGRYGLDCGTGARRAAYRTMDRILNETVPYVFLYSADIPFFVNARLQRPDPQPYGSYPGIEKWWLRP